MSRGKSQRSVICTCRSGFRSALGGTYRWCSHFDKSWWVKSLSRHLLYKLMITDKWTELTEQFMLILSWPDCHRNIFSYLASICLILSFFPLILSANLSSFKPVNTYSFGNFVPKKIQSTEIVLNQGLFEHLSREQHSTQEKLQWK